MTEAEIQTETLRRVEVVRSGLNDLADFLHKNRLADQSGLSSEIFHKVLVAENWISRIRSTLQGRVS